MASLGAIFLFTLGEYVLPFAEQRQMRFRNIIYGRPANYGLGSPAERNWHYSADGRIWHREEGTQETDTLILPSIYEFDRNFDLVRRSAAKRAQWNGQSWVFREGWERTFGGPTETSYRTFLEESVAGDAPSSFARERRTPEQMRWRELSRYVQRLRASGYPTGALETALQGKFATPLMIPLLALLAIPFAFRVGRRGALAGIGVGLALGMAFLIATEFFHKLGDVGVLPPPLAAFSPDILSATAAAYLLLRLRT
jgi:lipopolysaccharide export system permease protein